MRPHAVLAITALLGLSCFTYADDFTFTLEIDKAKSFNGLTLPADALYLIVASQRDAFFDAIQAGSQTAVGSTLNGMGGDDVVVARGTFTSAGGVLSTTGQITFSGDLSTNDRLALVWIPSANASTLTLAQGSAYGLYSKVAPADYSSGWITPAPGTTFYNLGFYTSDGTTYSPGVSATNPAEAGFANLAVVPEPNAALAAAFGSSVFLAFRRRR